MPQWLIKQMQGRKRGSERHSIYINTCTQKILYSSDTRDTFWQMHWSKQPVTNTTFGVIEDAKHAPLCHHTSPVPLDKQSTELAVWKTLFIHRSEAHSAFTSMTLQKNERLFRQTHSNWKSLHQLHQCCLNICRARWSPMLALHNAIFYKDTKLHIKLLTGHFGFNFQHLIWLEDTAIRLRSVRGIG